MNGVSEKACLRVATNEKSGFSEKTNDKSGASGRYETDS